MHIYTYVTNKGKICQLLLKKMKYWFVGERGIGNITTYCNQY